MRRTAVLGSAGTLIAGTLITGAIVAPAANAESRHSGWSQARGVQVAAERAAKKGIDWADCPADWGFAKPIQCGEVSVPLDYARPNGKQIKIAVDRIGNTGTKAERQGALVYNPGGPGGSGMRFPTRVTNKNPLWANTAKAYDFVGFDPRGVGHSTPISCVDPQEFVKAPKADPVPDSEADKRAQRKLAAEYADGCAERSGWMLAHMTTPNTARDLDVIRAALGEKKLNFLGVSYGTYLGAVYGTLFPSHVRRMIVDSVVNPSREKIWYEANLDQDVAFQMRWDDWKAWVAKNDATFHIGNTPEKVEQQWVKLRATAKKNPIGGVVGPAELLGLFQGAPYYDSAWVPVASTWSKYLAGDTQAIVDAAAPDMSDTAGNIASENGNAVYTAVECADAKWPTSWKKWDRDNTRLHQDYPFLTWSNAWMNLPCATWGAKQQTPLNVRTGKGLPPVLIVQATRDAATPFEGAVELHKRFEGSRLIIEKDAGSHGVTGLVNPCINERVDAYLLSGKLDSRDVTCAPHATPKP
ncbi:alpha/beta fold hydrolase [Streptomyces lunaelactis]|uniref:alpha/beta hydrolase n=1 Tax=Streptomyces lunaelactis TaxID=1535768 RepID=UPI001585AF89|nr:alpha/beta hydrolase [Streptomyces lunaelactis]NUJ99955.1 alpha/beta fold hydrolase [Streptomyces lunaelactis]NUK07670.1 alpha/beta fold hydrolase [Streptomyces lunaelactis]NUK19107.1 alpha/beta fold hydrolase [Streptomyces lunaelactis]NUK21908.1 alpha/beta fold hydrolase [Streptomyces lunaelactis]NUK33001.1 alpha/beta fold hydrolase [Streptomyces lunaelactis]